MLERIDHLWLRSFYQVCKFGSFNKAADYLGLPSSNISRHIAQLEESLSIRLFERTTRRVSITEHGQQLYESTYPLFAALDSALEESGNHARALRGNLRLLMPDLPDLAKVVTDFACLHPNIAISCDTRLQPDLSSLDSFDLVLSFNRGQLKDSGWVARKVASWPSVVVASPGWMAKHPPPATISELKDYPCITSLSAIGGKPWIFKQAGKEVTCHVPSRFKVNSGAMAKAAALKGMGLAILAEVVCRAELENGSLMCIALDASPADLELFAAYSSRKHVPRRVRTFLDFLGQHEWLV